MALFFQGMIKSALPYSIVAFSAVWLLWTAAEMRYLQGWYEAQGVDRFYYPYGEIAGGGVALFAAFILVRMNKWVVAVPIAIMVLLITEMCWIGATR